jgi:hypothetical protein
MRTYVSSNSRDNIDRIAHQFGGKHRQPVEIAIRPARLDGYVAAFDEPCVGQTLPKRRDKRAVC